LLLLILDIQEGFLPLGFFFDGVGFGLGGVLSFARRSVISLRTESSSFVIKGEIDSIPLSR
jgi:hypothetical protein